MHAPTEKPLKTNVFAQVANYNYGDINCKSLPS